MGSCLWANHCLSYRRLSRWNRGQLDRAILALLVGCGLRRAEVVSLDVDSIEQRESRGVIPDLLGKGNEPAP